MADDRMAVLESVRKAIADGDVDVLREGVRVLAQAVMEAEVTELTGVPHGERDPEHRLTRRNGYRERRSGHAGRERRAGHPARPRRELPALAARAAPTGRAGPPRRGLRRRIWRACPPAGSTISSARSASKG